MKAGHDKSRFFLGKHAGSTFFLVYVDGLLITGKGDVENWN